MTQSAAKSSFRFRNNCVPDHQCPLVPTIDPVVYHITSGCFVQSRRRFRKFCTIDRRHPQSHILFKSSTQIIEEEQRHLAHNYYVIHPFSKSRSVWEAVMIVVYLALFAIMPLEGVAVHTPKSVLLVKFVLDVCSWVDVVLYFCTGYYDDTKNKVVLRRRKVAVHYLTRYFTIDVLSSIPVNMIIVYGSFYLWHPFKYVFVLKICRLYTFMQFIRRFFERFHLWNQTIRFCRNLICLIIIMWWITCMCIMLSDTTHESHHDKMDDHHDDLSLFDHIYDGWFYVSETLMMIAPLNIIGDTPTKCCFKIFILYLALALNLFLFSMVYRIYSRVSKTSNKYESLTIQLTQYMKYKEIPHALSQRVTTYLDYKLERKLCDEKKVLGTLSLTLNQEIVMFRCQDMVKKMDFFANVPLHILMGIVEKVRSVIYLNGDVILEAGVPGRAMYFLYTGSVAVFTHAGQEICHLDSGSYFGEISLLTNEPRKATVVALGECELFRLSRKDFNEVIEPYPDLYSSIKQVALKRSLGASATAT